MNQERIERAVEEATASGWLTPEERVWNLHEARQEIMDASESEPVAAEAATKAKGGDAVGVAGDNTSGAKTPKDVEPKKRKKKLGPKGKNGSAVAKLLEGTRGGDLADKIAKKQGRNPTKAEMAKGGRKSKRGKKTVKVAVSNAKLTPTSKVKLKRALHDPTPDEELASGVAPNAEGKTKKRKKKGAAKKAAAGTAGFRVIGATNSKQGADKVKHTGQKKTPKKGLIKKLKKKMSNAGMTVVGGK